MHRVKQGKLQNVLLDALKSACLGAECSAPSLKTPNSREPGSQPRGAPGTHSVRSCHIGGPHHQVHHLL